MANRIPRKFNRIIGKMLIDTSESKVDDTLHIYKNDFGYLAFNTRTRKYAYIFVSMLRNSDIFKVLEIS